MTFAILKPLSAALFVKLIGVVYEASTASSYFLSRSCRLWASDFAMRPRWPFLRLGISGSSPAPCVRMVRYRLRMARYSLAQGLGFACVDPVAGLAQQFLHQACPAVTVGLDNESQFTQQMRATEAVPACVVGEV